MTIIINSPQLCWSTTDRSDLAKTGGGGAQDASEAPENRGATPEGQQKSMAEKRRYSYQQFDGDVVKTMP